MVLEILIDHHDINEIGNRHKQNKQNGQKIADTY